MGKPTDDNSRARSRGNDPRLKSFLRQARGVIAAERGFNAKSQLKLQSLAKHLKLPDELFQQGLEELKQTGKPIETDRWAKSFADFLDREFSRMSGGIVTIASEAKAVDLAHRKYQINEIRARQLIAERADAHGLGRVAPDEAKTYVEQLILARIGDLKTVDGPLRDQIRQSGLTWGLSPGEIDALVLEQLVRNRKVEIGRRRRKWGGVLLTVLAFCFVGYAGQYFGWWSATYSALFPVPNPEPVEIVTSATIDAHGYDVEWWDRELSEGIAELAAKNPGLRSTLNMMASPEEPVRIDGMVKFAEFACRENGDKNQDLTPLFVKAFCAEPQNQVASAVLDRFLVKLSPQKNRLPNRSELEFAFRVQEFLNRLWFDTREGTQSNDHSMERNGQVGDAIMAKFGIQPKDVSPAELGQQAAALLAQDQWDHIIRNSWTSPARASVLVEPQFQLSLGKMDRTLLNQCRGRAIETILQVDEGRWKDLKGPIEDAIEVADEMKVIGWIEIYQSCTLSEFGRFLGRLLIEKTKVTPESTQRSDVLISLARARTEYMTRRLQPTVIRNDLADRFSSESKGKSGVHEFEMTPSSIASLAFAANSSLAFANGLEDRDHDFGRFDFWTDDGLPDLTKLFPFGVREDNLGVRSTTAASASENRSKREAIAQLQDYQSLSTLSRQSAIEQLARVARRFEQISYLEAVSLADYFLSDMLLEEWLNVEKNLSSFEHWPNLGLAIADRLAVSMVKLDQAMTLFTLLFKAEYSVTVASQWREELQNEIYDRVAAKLGTHERTISRQSMNWERLKSYLRVAYQFRLEQLQLTDSARKAPSSSKTSDWAIANANFVVEQSRMAGFENIDRNINLISGSSFSDIEKTVLANQSLAEAIAKRLCEDFPARKWDIDAINLEYQQLSYTFDRVGQRLYLTELMLLKLWDLRRNESFQRKFVRLK